MKINCGRAFDADRNNGGWCFVIRDQEGHVHCAGAGRLPNVANGLHAEAEASLQALQAAVTIGAEVIDVETDAQNLKFAIEGNDQDLSSLGVLFR